MKRGILVAFLVLLFSVSFVFAVADYSCDDSQIIMRLSGETNAHVGAWSDSSYPIEICYDDYFDEVFSGDNPHECTGLNTVVNVYSTSNSHASNESDDVFTEELCYGNMQCVFDDSDGDDCSAKGESTVVAKAFREFNTHLAIESGESYTTKLCCADVFFAGVDGKMITEADFGDTVYLVAPKSLAGNNFEVKEDDAIFDDDIRTINAEGSNIVSSDYAYLATWTIASSDFDKTRDYTDFYFEVGGRKSTYLNIRTAMVDSRMDIDVNSPGCADYFNVGDSVDIAVSGWDSDDFIDGDVYVISDTETVHVGEFDNYGLEASVVLNSAGEYQIIANATNSRGKKSRAISNFMVIDTSDEGAKYAAACIISPEDYSDFDETYVYFDASATRGIEIVGGVPVFRFPGEDSFVWNWTFTGTPDKGGTLAEVYNAEGISSDYYQFSLKYPGAGSKSASLIVSLS